MRLWELLVGVVILGVLFITGIVWLAIIIGKAISG